MVSSNGTIQDSEGLLDVKGVAALLKVGRNKVYALVDQGMPSVDLGDRKKRFVRSSVLNWIKEREISARRKYVKKKAGGREKATPS